jgi:hypothetical protein
MKPNSWLERLGVVYLVFANSIVLIVVVLLGIFTAWWFSDDSRKGGFTKTDFVSKLIPEARSEYGHLSDNDVDELLSETWNMRDGGWVFEQWTGFRERARVGKFVNVSEFGTRSTGKPGGGFASLNGSLWMFGGSTTFGYGVADNETIPAFLQDFTSRDVVNFGRGYYYSAQENMLLKHLLAAGLVPSKVVFLDGINERCNIDVYQPQMGELFDTAQVATNWSTSSIFRPVKYLAYKILLRLGGTFHHRAPYDADMMRLSCMNFGVERKLPEILRANLVERQLLCRQYNIECLTFVQPFASIHGIHLDEKALAPVSRDSLKSHYEELKGIFAETGAISIVDALAEKKTHAFIDNVHYSASANKLIAKSIASFVSRPREPVRESLEEHAEH